MGVVQKIFYLHLPVAINTFAACAVVFVASVGYLWRRQLWWDDLASAAGKVAVLGATLVLATGMIWGHVAWGAWWTWSPRLTFSLVLWLLYAVYLITRGSIESSQRRALVGAVYGVLAFLDVPLVYLSARLLPDIHPRAIELAGPMKVTLAVWLVAVTAAMAGLMVRGYGVSGDGRRRSVRREKRSRGLRGSSDPRIASDPALGKRRRSGLRANGEEEDVSILLIGLNHKTAPVELREQLAFSREGVSTALMLFRNHYPEAEAMILSTCNRVEMLVATDAAQPTAGQVVSFLAQARDLAVQTFRGHLYELVGEQAMRHVLRVAAGLDSMVVGEYQIVSQLKGAYAAASEQGTTGRVLNRLVHHALATSKRVRTETELGQRKVSVPSVAVEVAKQVFSDFADKRCLVVGAGEMAQLVCEHLREAKLTAVCGGEPVAAERQGVGGGVRGRGGAI